MRFWIIKIVDFEGNDLFLMDPQATLVEYWVKDFKQAKRFDSESEAKDLIRDYGLEPLKCETVLVYINEDNPVDAYDRAMKGV
jgi:hypothetical protein